MRGSRSLALKMTRVKRFAKVGHFFRPSGARGDFDAKRIPQLALWAKIFLPSGPEW
jgi:hypothetical protein